ncbi:hypothetical protein HG535_0H02760 [Zygotorulaspora mrakii]|uniref:Tyrosine--tRNA ligase n=1 Tax=Zygotorulaspora mrakii TaxID=42260 RepID=A0A7H9BAA3_ZYGMR|nr:uncharacterized protein HG535_0H02760 [Zygotorulaspora mrakii]QLG74949.1 hypothetical protein HG535_0H02760 [Zygotorulaspora mrakii]
MSRFVRFARSFSNSSAARRHGLLHELRDRGLISQISQPEDRLISQLDSGHKIKLYCGADPTAHSLHLGNMVPLMVLLNFYVRGHDIVSLVGGATGRVGDPSGKKIERDILPNQAILQNVQRINDQLKRFFENGLKYYRSKNVESTNVGSWTSVDNYDWWKDISMLGFLAKYGRHIRIQSMLSRDSVSSRLEGSGGLGFNEFAYQILQAYDFYHLFNEQNVTVQVGGNDQWGNITAGIDLINRISPKAQCSPPTGLTVPLLTNSAGEKFGKSAGNAMFIDPEISTPFDIYQFFFNISDSDVSRFLKIFTLLPLDEVETAVVEHMKRPHLRNGQKLLASEVTELLHGAGSGKEAQIVSDIIFGDTHIINTLNADEIIRLFNNARILEQGKKSESLMELICRMLKCSKSEGKRKLGQGSISLGPLKKRVVQDLTDWSSYLIDDKLLMLRIGKQKCLLIEMT